MDAFTYQRDQAQCEQLSLLEIQRTYSTPTFVYSQKSLLESAGAFKAAFDGYPTLPCYAVKANSNLHLLRLLNSIGYGADIVSGGELERALRAGCKADTVVYSGVGKTEAEIVSALNAGILAFNVESEAEIQQLQAIAKQAGKVAPISIRINPNIEVKTHPHIATGLYCTKFGVDETQARALIPRIKDASHLKWIGVGCHIGSQILEVAPFRQAAKRMVQLAAEFQAEGFKFRHLDLGGGFGVRYSDEVPPSLPDFAKALIDEVKPSGLKLLLEPGRIIVANSGVLLTKVLLKKTTPEKTFVVVDAAMNDLIRPALYEAHHDVCVVTGTDAPPETVDIVGPVCESGDFLAQGRPLAAVKANDLLFIRSAGAYGMSMASNYNSRPRAAEVLVDGTKAKLIRRRETLQDLLRPEEEV